MNAHQQATSTPGGEREGLRVAMSWLHTWAGLVLGWLLFAIFLTGTLALFKTEIGLWMRPEMHGLPRVDAPAADKALATLHGRAPGVTQWIMTLPDERDPALSLLWRDRPNGRFVTLYLHPQTGQAIDTRQTMGGDFFYRFHFELRSAQQGRWTIEGRWVVGAATMVMLVALISGVITHRRIFKDFFTFRPAKGGQRAWLDAHNATGVLVLPFYLMIAFSGLMIFHTQYLPAGMASTYRNAQGVDTDAYLADLLGDRAGSRPRRGPGVTAEPLPAIALAPILRQAQARWDGSRIGSVQARRDAKGRAVVEVMRHKGDRLQYRPPRLLFDAATGQWLGEADVSGPAAKTYGVLMGLHKAHFAGMGLRWALAGFGLLGSLTIATGLVLWSVKRGARAQTPASRRGASGAGRAALGERLVAGIHIATLAGLPLACGMFLAANRLLPVGMANRADAELAWFFGTWGAALLWALACTVVRPSRVGWCLPLGAAGLVWAALPLLNALTTHTHLGLTLPAGDGLWAGMDLAFLATGLVLGWLGWRLRPGRAPRAKAANTPRTAALAATPDISATRA